MEFPTDIWKYLAQWLNDVNRFHLMVTNKEMMKLDLTFNQRYNFHNIFGLSFYNNFTNIHIAETIMILNKKSINGNVLEFPNKMSILQIHRHRFLKGDIIIPSSVNYLLITDKESSSRSNVVNYIMPDSIKYCYLSDSVDLKKMSNSITHLIADNIDTGIIPSSVTHFALRHSGINIPSFITHLAFDYYYVVHKNSIPQSVKTLKIYTYYDELKDCIPSSITHLIFKDIYCYQIKIPSSVTHLTISKSSWEKFPKTITHVSVPHIFEGEIPERINVVRRCKRLKEARFTIKWFEEYWD